MMDKMAQEQADCAHRPVHVADPPRRRMIPFAPASECGPGLSIKIERHGAAD